MAASKKIPTAAEIEAFRSGEKTRLFGRKLGKKLRAGRQSIVDAALPDFQIGLDDVGWSFRRADFASVVGHLVNSPLLLLLFPR